MEDSHSIGSPMLRREDRSLVTGEGRYTDDFHPPNVGYVTFLRSTYGHAAVESIDPSAALDRAGVIDVFTAEDLQSTGISRTITTTASPPGGETTDRPLLAGNVVRFSGEILAVVVTEDRYLGNDVISDIQVHYDRHDAVTDPREAVTGHAPSVHKSVPDNVAFDWEFGECGPTRRAMDDADHTASLDLHNQRLIPNPMEPRGMIAEYDPDSGGMSVVCSTQRPHTDRAFLTKMLGLQEHKLTVNTPAVGGAFGSKGRAYPEKALVAWGAMQLERPLKWVATRSEAFQADLHSRDFHVLGEIGVDDDGTLRAVEIEGHLGVGAYVGWGPTTAKNIRHLLSGQYAIPRIAGRIVGAFTNTAPIGPYRGAGRPESIYTIERLVDHAAHEIGMDPVILRRRNMIDADRFPHRTVVGATYDSGDYERTLDLAIDLARYNVVREEQRNGSDDGTGLVGVGLSCFVENTGSSPRSNPGWSKLVLRRSGVVTAYCGTADHGQGHQTTFAQLLHTELGVPYDDIEIREGNTADLINGNGTFGSRSAAVGGSALQLAARDLVSKARTAAARHLEADERDVSFDTGEFFIDGSPDRSVHIQTLATSGARNAEDAQATTAFEATALYDPLDYAYSFGTHVAVVEIDPQSGELAVRRYVAVDDCGTQINPKVVEGQIHGGIVQGIGQALYEQGVYDDTGTLLTGSFQDYALPRAGHLPEMEVDDTITPCPHNPLGVKGVGESGTIAAPPAIVNAVVDALKPYSVDHIDMPITPEKIWRTVNR